MTVETINPAIAQELGLPFNARGVVVRSVEQGSPAHRMGLATGDVILNLKGVVLKMHNEETKTAHISVHREGVVTAGDIVVDPDVEVVNPDWAIATLDAGATLEMELQIERGKGFVPASYDYQRRCAGAPGDWLPLYRARVEKER